MFDIKKFKKFAKTQLKSRMTVPILMTLITVLILHIINIPAYKSLFSLMQNLLSSSNLSEENIEQILNAHSKSPFINMLSWVRIIFAVILTMAQLHVYLKMARSPEPVSMNDFFQGFNLYLRAILAALWQFIFIFLWSLLFLIPGIIKAYSYSQTNFLVAEFSSLQVLDAINISKKITKGYKLKLFLLDLSFIGYGFLVILTLGLAYFWVNPYITMTKTNAYHALLKNAIEDNIITTKDLGC